MSVNASVRSVGASGSGRVSVCEGVRVRVGVGGSECGNENGKMKYEYLKTLNDISILHFIFLTKICILRFTKRTTFLFRYKYYIWDEIFRGLLISVVVAIKFAFAYES